VIGVDTNVLLRYLLDDGTAQAERARALFEAELSAANPAWLSLVVIVETAWVLRRAQRVTTSEVRHVIAGLLETEQLVVEAPDIVRAALGMTNDDVADAIIHLSGRVAGCSRTVTFDREFARQPGVDLLT